MIDLHDRECRFPVKFAPVPRGRARHDGWSADRQSAFIHALWRLPSVGHAARSVGMTARSAYRLRAAPGAEEFAGAWDEALDEGHALDVTIERALTGEEVAHHYRGQLIGTRRKYDNGLLIACLIAHRNPPNRKRLPAHVASAAPFRHPRDYLDATMLPGGAIEP